jgi:hypothetical protein
LAASFIFVIIEACAFVLWQFADGLHGYICVFVHWVSLICIAAGPVTSGYKFMGRVGRFWLWILYAVACLLLALLAKVVWAPYRPVVRAPEPVIPSMEITTLPGLSTESGEVTMGMYQKYRERRLVIRNPNSVDLRNFTARVQLPEPATTQPPASIGPLTPDAPPGINIRWAPEHTGWFAMGVGWRWSPSGGPSTTEKMEWQLAIATIPALTQIKIPFLTIPNTIGGLRSGFTETNSRVLIDYLDGSFQYGGPEGWKTQRVLMPILFDPTNRTLRTLPSENTGTNWSRIQYRQTDMFDSQSPETKASQLGSTSN